MKIAWLFLGLLAFAAFAWAAPPTVSFTRNVESPTVYQNILFDPSVTSSPTARFMYWQFDTDGNVNYNLLDGNLPFFDENFNDGTLADWNVTSGSWSVASNYASTSSADGRMNRYVPIQFDRNLTIQFRGYYSTGGGYFMYFGGQSTGLGNGYRLGVDGSTTVLTRVTDGGASATEIITAGALSANTFHNFRITVLDRNFSLYANGAYLGSVVDTTYNDANFILLRNALANETRFDDINYTYGDANQLYLLDQNQNRSFQTPGQKRVVLTVGNADGNTSFAMDFNVFSGIILKVFDENTRLALPTAKADFEGSTYFANADANITIPINVLDPGDYTVRVYDSNYPARTFVFDINALTALNVQIYLYPDQNGRSFDFVIRDQNNVKHPRSFFRIEREGKLVYRAYANELSLVSGVYLANLVHDYNFFVDLNSLAGTNLFSYGNNRWRVLVPKNENTQETISPWAITVTDLTSIDQNNLVTAFDFNVYPNTRYPYKVQIDANQLTYFSRFYNLRSIPKEYVKTLQPYMLRASDGAASASMTLLNTLTGASIPNNVVEFRTDVGDSTNILVESGQSDSAGKFLFTTLTNKRYDLRILDTYGDTVMSGPWISSTDTTYFIDLFTGATNLIEPVPGTVDFNIIIPESRIIYHNDANLFQIQFSVITTGPQVTSVDLLVDQNTTRVVSQNFTPNAPASTFVTGSVINHTFLGLNSNQPAKVTIIAYTTSGAITRTYTFGVRAKQNVPTLIQNFTQIRVQLGEFGGILLWFIIMLGIAAAIRFSPFIPANNAAIIFIEIIWTLIAMWIMLIPAWAAGTAILGAIGLWYLTNNRTVG